MITQISALIKKNFIVSVRNGEILQESLIPIVVAIILSLKQYLNTLNQVTPIIYSLAVLSTSRSIMIKLVEEKSQRYRESQKIMGMKNISYKLGWLLTGYLRMTLSLIIFQISQYGFNILFNLNWDFFYRVPFDDLMWPYIIYGYAAINQSFFFSSIFNDTKIVGEVSTFFCVGCSFFVYFTFMNQAADSLVFYIIISLVSPQCNVGFEYISSLQVGLNRSGCKGPKIPNQIVPINIFPSELIYQTYDSQQAGIQLFCTFLLYLILYLYFDEIVQDEYGISKHPLFFFSKKQEASDEKEKLLDNDQSSAIYNQQFETNQKANINICNLIKTFNDKNAIDNLSLQLYSNEMFCLLGHNGAGKTTLISVLTGMICKTSGQIYINGLNLDKDLNEIRLSIGLCTQKDCLYDELTVDQHLQYFAAIKQIQSYEQINEILSTTELQSLRNKQVQQLSGGEKRKLSLAISLVGNSKLLFLDEPTSGMDAFSRRQIWQIIERIKNQNRTIILTTHYLEEAELLAQRIGIMSRGKLVAVGSAEYIKKQFGEGYTLKMKGLPKEFELKKYISDVTLVSRDNEQESYLLPFSQQFLLKDLFYELELQNVQVELTMNTLEDAFIKIGIDEDKLIQQLEKSSFELQEKVQIKLKNNNLKKFTPIYNFKQQCVAMFQRRFFTVIRTTTNMIAFIMPVLTFFLGIMVTNYLQFPIKIQDDQTIENFIKVSVLAVVGVVGFSFNSTLYITQTVSERESTLKQILKKMGLKIQAYWIGTFLFDTLVYILVSSSFFLTGICLQLDALMNYFWMTFFLFASFGYSYLTFIYICSFMFDKVEKAMRVFVIVAFFITFCIPFMILGILNFLYTIHGIVIFYYFMIMTEFVLMVNYFILSFKFFSPFYNFFLGYTAIPNISLQLTQQITGLPVILKQTYQYCLMMIFQGVIFTIILIFLERRLIKRNKFNTSQFVIEATNLQKSYDGKQLALNDINIQLKKGEILGVIGPNGAGKSTLINIFIDLIEQSNGMALINGQNDLSIGICPQYDCLWEDLTVLEHLNIFAKLKGMQDPKDIQNQISYYTDNLILNLYLNTKAGKLSGGNKRKLCVANALIGGSEILFFDEPTTGVDPSSKRSLISTIQKTFEYGGYTVILSTLSVDEAQQLANPIGILVQGKFIKYDSPANLISKYSNAYHVTINLTNKDHREKVHLQIMNLFKQAQTLEDIRQDSLSIQINFDSFNFYKCFNLLTQLKKEDLIQDFSINQSSLEQVFLHFVKQHKNFI